MASPGQYVRVNAKETTDDYRTLSVNLCYRKGFLSPDAGIHLEWSRGDYRTATLNGKMNAPGDRMDVAYREHFGSERGPGVRRSIRIEWIPRHLGGHQAYFLCPGSGCGRRVAVLHCGQTIGCRLCLKLNYQCQRDSAPNNALSRAERIRKRLGWEPGVFFGHGDRPPRMYRRTFERLVAEHDAWVSQSMAGLAERIGLPDLGD